MKQTNDINFHDHSLIPIWEKIQRGERLTLEDGLTLYNSRDLISIGKMAQTVQYAKNGDAVYFVLNRKIEPTNICVLSCKFCDFAVKKNNPNAYQMTIEQILSKLSPELHEVHITGGLHPDLPWEFYIEMMRQIKARFPNIDIKAWTAVEIDFFSKKFKMSIEEVLLQLKEAGLRTMPGGGAEVFSERVRRRLFNQKIGAMRWLHIHRTAHRLGIPTNATLLYGHIETYEERLRHMMKLRELQDETGGFLTFIPLAFQPGKTGIATRFTSAIDDLKTIAISRLMLDNFPHIKAYWVMLTEEIASVALNFGADDINGTIGEEHIAHDAGAVTPMKLAKEQIIGLIHNAGKIPVERDIFYNPIAIHAAPPVKQTHLHRHPQPTRHIVGKFPYLNSEPFYAFFSAPRFHLIPMTPRRMGALFRSGFVDAGPISFSDYLSMPDLLERLPYGIAVKNKARSVLLFSKFPWRELHGKRIGITDDTATSVQLLRVLLTDKYRISASLTRLLPIEHMNRYSDYDAVLLIGDQALQRAKLGLQPFELIYDLGEEWYEWKELPFVFAVWAVRSDQTKVTPEERTELAATIEASIVQTESRGFTIGIQHGKRIGLLPDEVIEYLKSFNFRFGEKEEAAMQEFRKHIIHLQPIGELQEGYHNDSV